MNEREAYEAELQLETLLAKTINLNRSLFDTSFSGPGTIEVKVLSTGPNENDDDDEWIFSIRVIPTSIIDAEPNKLWTDLEPTKVLIDDISEFLREHIKVESTA